MTSFPEANAAYEDWMRKHLDKVVEDDLERKHEEMAKKDAAFAFLRATCFRFAEILPEVVPSEWLRLTAVPSVGDAHLENFGTWRDAEGRLIWGVNDLDEAALLPWPVDLLRLATSALLAPAAPASAYISATLLAGHTKRLGKPRPFVLDTRNAKLREMANPSLGGRRKFWKDLKDDADQPPPGKPPKAVARALKEALPGGTGGVRIVRRVGGLGSLGRQRFLALGTWRGGRVAREAKAQLPSAYLYADVDYAQPLDPFALAIGPHRTPDPWLREEGGFVLRRLAPDSRKIEAEDVQGLTRLLTSMGGELANFHASGGKGAKVASESADMDDGWLARYALRLKKRVLEDHRVWRETQR